MVSSRAHNLHRPSFGTAADAPSPGSGPRGMPGGIDDDRLVAYAISAEPVFAGMRALIGQLAGMLILAQARRWRDVPDQPDLAALGERRKEVADYLGLIEAPDARQADLARLKEAMTCVDRAVAVVTELRGPQTREAVVKASTDLKAAYRLMQSACDHRLGLAMVDKSDACCSCGARLA